MNQLVTSKKNDSNSENLSEEESNHNKNYSDKNEKNREIPRSSSSDKSFRDFVKICKGYYQELRNINMTNQLLSKDDVIVLNDLVKEMNSYGLILIRNNFNEEARKIINLCVKIIDFMLKIFNNQITSDTEEGLSTKFKLAYPFSLKLMVLETKFQLYFNIEENYEEAEKILNEIIRIQSILQLPRFHIGCSTFYMALIKFFTNNIREAEELALQSLKSFEINQINFDNFNENVEEDSQRVFIENRITRKISTVLEFLAEIYNLKSDYKNVLVCYEKAYYLNLGRYGAKNINTEYFKIKIEIFNEQTKNENMNSEGMNYSQNFNNSVNWSGMPIGNYNPSSSVQNSFTNNQRKYNLNNRTEGINTSNGDLTKINNSNNTQNNNVKGILDIKGNTSTFKFIVTYSNSYEPLIISIYDLMTNVDNENIFIKNLYFDKTQLFKYLKISAASHSELYNEINLMRLINSIILINGKVSLLDNFLKTALLNSYYNKSALFNGLGKSIHVQMPSLYKK